jgi:membrane-bound lytic murein transglycosylase A
MTATDLTFEPVSFCDLPSWAQDDHAAAFRAFRNTCELSTGVGNGNHAAGGVAPLLALANASESDKLSRGRLTRAAARAFFETYFTPHRVLHVGPRGLLTGYYEPVLNGTRKPEGRFRYPIYRRPPDLVNLIEESMRGAEGMTLTHARRTKNGLQPYPTRAEIESGALKGRGLELVYVTDPVAAFFMHIQGSGRIRLPDGTTIRLSYDGKNGHPYSSIGRHLIETGQLAADRVSLQRLAEWLKADPDRGQKVMWHNASFVFFRELEGVQAKAPLGVFDVPLTPGRSLAVDASVHAIGTPIYVSAPTLLHALPGGPWHRLMIAQDVGSAIKGPERGDIFFGSGRAAGRRAGATKHAGNFFVLLPRASVAAPSARTRRRPKALAKHE